VDDETVFRREPFRYQDARFRFVSGNYVAGLGFRPAVIEVGMFLPELYFVAHRSVVNGNFENPVIAVRQMQHVARLRVRRLSPAATEREPSGPTFQAAALSQ
jgi:hypothetical protein